jgi:hypothetical protein
MMAPIARGKASFSYFWFSGVVAAFGAVFGLLVIALVSEAIRRV